MSIRDKANVENHLSTRRREILLPHRPTTQPDAGNQENDLRDAQVIAPSTGASTDRLRSSAKTS